jgi:hypothetical protein
MDHVEYRRTDNRNFLFLTKAIKSWTLLLYFAPAL